MSADKAKLWAEDRPHAPIIHFDTALIMGHSNGMASVTLCAELQLPESDGIGVRHEKVVVAYLRTTVTGARNLRDALDKALLLEKPAESGAKN